MKKILLVIFVFLFLTAGQAQADLLPLVQCGGDGQSECTFCSFFDMISRAVQIIILMVVPLVATLMLVVGGAMLLFAGADPGLLTKAKSLIKSTIIGLVVIFAAFLIIGTILSAIGLAGWTESFYKNWWSEGFFRIPGC
ncbi:MAG: hypothetical protein ABIG29_00575 [Candidatus Nealsonbacteria bacterium]